MTADEGGRPPILVGVDFSDGSAAAVAEARGLAERIGCGLRFVHVAETRDFSLEGVSDWLERAGVSADEVVVRRGTPWLEIVRCSFEMRPACIVVGTHGASGYQPLMPGATTTRLLLRSPVPVLVVAVPRRTDVAVAS